jgi:hypothetical protein
LVKFYQVDFLVKVQKSGLSLKIYLVNFYQKVGQILPSFFVCQSPKMMEDA